MISLTSKERMQEMHSSERRRSVVEQQYDPQSPSPSKSDAAECRFYQNQLLPRDGNDHQSQAEFAINWRQFKEAGLFDESIAAAKHRNALLDRESKLQKELLNYQHNVGLLLIEKEEWGTRFKQLSEDVEEAQAILKREKQRNLIEFSESQIREENLQNSLTSAKQSIINCRKILHDLQEEYTRVRNGLDTTPENHVLKSEHISNGDKLVAEVNAMSFELDKKLRELDGRERLMNIEQLGFKAMREDHEANLRRRREELKEMENKQRHRMEELSELLTE